METQQKTERTTLVYLLDRLKSLSLAEGFDAVLDETEDLRQKLASDRFEIVVMGQFKRGKSSLINALLGADVLPTGSVPLTSVMTLVRHAKTPSVKVHFKKKAPVDASLDQLALFITEKGNPRNEKSVVRVEVGVDSPFLAGGDVLVDTPGVGSTHAHNTQAAYDTLPRADAVLYVLSVDPPIGEEDLKFLKSIRSFVSKIFFVLNKKDYLPEKEFEENRAFTEQVLKSALQVEGVSLFPVSARWGREGRLGADAGLFAKSGVGEMESQLREFLKSGKGRRVLERTAARAEEAARSALALVEMEHRAYLSNSLDLETRAWSLSSYINNVFMEGAVAKRRLKGAVSEYQQKVRKAAEDFARTAARPLAKELAAAAAGSARVSPSELAARLERLYEARGKEILTEYFHEKETWMTHTFDKLRSDYEGRILHQLDGVWKTAADLFGPLPATETRPPAAVPLPDVFFQSGVKWTPALVKKLAGAPKPGRRKKAEPSGAAVQRAAERDLARAADAVVDAFLHACALSLGESIGHLERLSRQAQELADRAVKVVVQRQTANEAEVAQKLALIRQRLTGAQGLFNDIAAFRKAAS